MIFLTNYHYYEIRNFQVDRKTSKSSIKLQRDGFVVTTKNPCVRINSPNRLYLDCYKDLDRLRVTILFLGTVLDLLSIDEDPKLCRQKRIIRDGFVKPNKICPSARTH